MVRALFPGNAGVPPAMSANEAQRSEARTSPVATTTSRRISAANAVFALRSTSFRSALIAGETPAFPVAELFFPTDPIGVVSHFESEYPGLPQRHPGLEDTFWYS